MELRCMGDNGGVLKYYLVKPKINYQATRWHGIQRFGFRGIWF
jgi:hypothetical protein